MTVDAPSLERARYCSKTVAVEGSRVVPSEPPVGAVGAPAGTGPAWEPTITAVPAFCGVSRHSRKSMPVQACVVGSVTTTVVTNDQGAPPGMPLAIVSRIVPASSAAFVRNATEWPAGSVSPWPVSR